jgi:hypothetical protein
MNGGALGEHLLAEHDDGAPRSALRLVQMIDLQSAIDLERGPLQPPALLGLSKCTRLIFPWREPPVACMCRLWSARQSRASPGKAAEPKPQL